MGVIVYLLGKILPSNNLMKLIIQIGIGFIIYIVGCKLARVQELTYSISSNSYTSKAD